MLSNACKEGRYAFVLLLLCALVASQSVGVVSANEQHQSHDHCCLLCHVGPLPFVNTTVSAAVMPVLSVVWLEPSSDFEATHELQLTVTASRAPPA
ncbi:MAG TPA: hypothetical protein VLY04_07665 [Bryobacteraceae bacterium]|nr:hypothetical protein [Bryobacteraceae bacterium]